MTRNTRTHLLSAILIAVGMTLIFLKAIPLLAQTYSGNDQRFANQGPWWQTDSGYTLGLIDDRMVTGDFDGDGDEDIATFYGYDGDKAIIHTFLSTDGSFEYQGAWWQTASGYRLDAVGGRMVAGDFDSDGDDDIATFYDYGDGNARIHVFLSTGSSFTYSNGSSGWWRQPTVYYPNTKIAGRMVAGDFDNDGDDDIATFYDYGGGNARIQVFLSTGSSFTRSNNNFGWWRQPTVYYPNTRIADRMVAGDFDNNGYDDIATFYDYDNGKARIQVFLSTGSRFTRSNGSFGWWRTNNGYMLDLVGDRMVAGDFDNDGYDDIATFYSYGDKKARIDTFLSTGERFVRQEAWWQTVGVHDLESVAGRMVAGDFDNDRDDDIATFYDKGPGKAAMYAFIAADAIAFCDNPSADIREIADMGTRLVKYCLVQDDSGTANAVYLYYYPNGSQEGKYTNSSPLIVHKYGGNCPSDFQEKSNNSDICTKSYSRVDDFDDIYTRSMFNQLFTERQQVCLTAGVECYVAPIGEGFDLRYGWACGKDYGRGGPEARDKLFNNIFPLDNIDVICQEHDLGQLGGTGTNDTNLALALGDVLYNEGKATGLDSTLLTPEARAAGEGIFKALPKLWCTFASEETCIKNTKIEINASPDLKKLQEWSPGVQGHYTKQRLLEVYKIMRKYQSTLKVSIPLPGVGY